MDENQPSLLNHFSSALTLVRSHTIIIWWTVLLSMAHTTALIIDKTSFGTPFSIMLFVLSIGSTPIIYGIYYELIEDCYSSVALIARTYLLRYTWLLVRMYLPAVFIAGLPMVMAPDQAGGGYFHIILISFSLIYLYVIPLFYFSGKQHGAITLGIQYLLSRFSLSTPLILIVFLLETSMLLFQQSKTTLFEHNFLVFVSLDFGLFFIASMIDFTLFIILILQLKNDFGK